MTFATVGSLRLRLKIADWSAVAEWSGDALPRVAALDYVRAQLERFDAAQIREALTEFGGACGDDEKDRLFLVWVAANIMRDAAELGPTETYRG